MERATPATFEDTFAMTFLITGKTQMEPESKYELIELVETLPLQLSPRTPSPLLVLLPTVDTIGTSTVPYKQTCVRFFNSKNGRKSGYSY